MAQSKSDDPIEIKQKLENIGESLRQKYLEVLKSLDLEELKHFNKSRLKTMAIADFTEQLPDADKKVIDSHAQCISNYLQNEAKSLKSAKLRNQVRTTRNSLQKGQNTNNEGEMDTKNTKSSRKSRTIDGQLKNHPPVTMF